METEATAKNILLIKHLKIRRHLISFSFLPFYFRVCDFSTKSKPGTGLDCGDGAERYEQEKRGWGGVVWECCGFVSQSTIETSGTTSGITSVFDTNTGPQPSPTHDTYSKNTAKTNKIIQLFQCLP